MSSNVGAFVLMPASVSARLSTCTSCAKAFAAEGANVILVSRSADTLNAAANDIRSRHQANVKTHAADLSQESAREDTMARFSDIDILVNNAGAIPGGSILDMSMAKWTEAWALKVMGYIHMTQLALKQMKPRKSGTIVNIIGMAGPSPRWDYICGSTGNAGLNAFTKGIGAGAAASRHRCPRSARAATRR